CVVVRSAAAGLPVASRASTGAGLASQPVQCSSATRLAQAVARGSASIAPSTRVVSGPGCCSQCPDATPPFEQYSGRRPLDRGGGRGGDPRRMAPPLAPAAALVALAALAPRGEAIVAKVALRSRPESDQPGSEVMEAASTAGKHATRYPSSALEGIQAVPLKAWLVGCYLAAIVISSGIRQRSSGGAARRAAGTDKPVGRQTPASPAAVARSEASPLLPDSKRPSAREGFEAAAILLVWMVVSPMFILLNKWCFTSGGFPFPITLTAMHMGSCFAVFGAVSWLPKGLRTRIMPDVDTAIPWGVYCK
ncbi:unnamed protein product, partial [Prorocentrum cordatum]